MAFNRIEEVLIHTYFRKIILIEGLVSRETNLGRYQAFGVDLNAECDRINKNIHRNNSNRKLNWFICSQNIWKQASNFF